MAVIKKFRITTFKKNLTKVSMSRISLSFNKRQILDDISCNIQEGQIVGLLGPNGVGKSTLFNILIGQLKPDFGKIVIKNSDVTNVPVYERAIKFGISIVPQIGGVFSNLTCHQNLTAIGEIVLKDKNERNYKIQNMISKFQLDAVKDVKAKHLSGGQRKKCSIAMALLSNPKIILMDEPFQGLDIISTRDLQETIVNLQTEDNSRSCIISDHAARDLLAISDKAIILANKKIVAEGKPLDILNDKKAISLYFGDNFKIN